MPSSNVSVISHSSSNDSAASNGSKAPKPMPMAIMRNAHEVIRGAMSDIQCLLDQNDFEGARALWHRFNRFSDLHMKMEEGRKGCNARGLFGLVDDYGGKVAKRAGLRDHHSTLYELEEDVVDIFERAPDEERAKEVYPIFREENEAHLEEEESILMPAIQAMIKQGVPVKKYIQSDILPVLMMMDDTNNTDDLEFFIRFANEILQKHDVVKGKPRVRVFDHALWALAKDEQQWKEWNAWIQDSLEPEKYHEVTMAIDAFQQEQKAKKAAGKNASPPTTPPIKSILKVEKPKEKSFFTKIFSSSSA